MNSRIKYLLEAPSEIERLSRQSELPAYDFKKELAGLKIKPGSRILDAGCGTGVVSRFLAANHAESSILACDGSPDRVEATRKLCQGLSNVETAVVDLASPGLKARSFDLIICRYVLQHVARPEAISKVLANFHELLKPNGTLLVIDVDGFFANLHPQPANVAAALESFVRAGHIDLFVGRKIPQLLETAGFTGIKWKVEVVDCQAALRADEVRLTEQRLGSMREFLISFFGGERACEAFVSEYLETLANENSVYFFNKFIIRSQRTKPLSILEQT